jgi:hypothetical protein
MEWCLIVTTPTRLQQLSAATTVFASTNADDASR